MPGIDALRTRYEGIDVSYRDLPDGAEIAYRTDDPQLAAAVRTWFAAQLRDHAGAPPPTEAAGDDHSSHPGHRD